MAPDSGDDFGYVALVVFSVGLEMDYRCPICNANLGKRRLSEAVVLRMERDCSHCKNTIRVNIHRAEVFAVTLNFGMLVILAVLAYWLRSQYLVVLVFGAALMSALGPLLSRGSFFELGHAMPRLTAVETGSVRPDAAGSLPGNTPAVGIRYEAGR